ncbi:hypothetical protein G5S35_22345 [Paraburkholderia tropica]|uniref:hypothetical protein n=1 Tax=Paraburkholderia tropica TaxID=92647 RepID=UPI001602019F|nr:hypothetical protein [Paraburkholderia tropica]QNB14281.1 hypothetical protein G5S35_22345 [Paraburkholderia tropica]
MYELNIEYEGQTIVTKEGATLREARTNAIFAVLNSPFERALTDCEYRANYKLNGQTLASVWGKVTLK